MATIHPFPVPRRAHLYQPPLPIDYSEPADLGLVEETTLGDRLYLFLADHPGFTWVSGFVAGCYVTVSIAFVWASLS